RPHPERRLVASRDGARSGRGEIALAPHTSTLRGREIHHPVDLPAPPIVRRERLLPPAGLRRGPRPEEAHADRPPLEPMLGVERADAMLEAPDHGRINRRGIAAVEPVDPPGPGLGIEGPERDADIGVARQVELVLVDIADAMKERPGARRAPEIVP